MTDKTKQVNRIPHESLTESEVVSSWSIPTVASKKSKLVFSKKREQEKNKNGKKGTGEIVEDYKGPLKPKPITAEELSKLTKEASKEGYDTGYAEGFSKGLQEGSAKGVQEGQKKAYHDTKMTVDDEVARIAAIAGSLLEPMQNQEAHLEKIILDMAVGFAKELIFREIERVPQSILDVVNHALLALPSGSSNISVFVSKDDAELIERLLPEGSRSWHVKVDETLGRGGCRIETLESLVDYTLEHRLQRFLHEVNSEGDISTEHLEPFQEYEIEQDVSTSPPDDGAIAKKQSVSEKNVAEDITPEDSVTVDDSVESVHVDETVSDALTVTAPNDRS